MLPIIKKMASITFSVNETGQYQICNRKEVLHELRVFLGKMWNGCCSCQNSEHFTNYSFVSNKLERVGFGKGKITLVFSVCTKKRTRHGFEIEENN